MTDDCFCQIVEVMQSDTGFERLDETVIGNFFAGNGGDFGILHILLALFQRCLGGKAPNLRAFIYTKKIVIKKRKFIYCTY